MIDYTAADGSLWYISTPIAHPGYRRRVNRMYGWGLGYVGTYSSLYNARRAADRRAAGKPRRRAYNRVKSNSCP